MKAVHRGYTIIADTQTAKHGYWTFAVRIITPDGREITDLDLGRQIMFAAELLAEQAAVVLARHWIDEQEEKAGGSGGCRGGGARRW